MSKKKKMIEDEFYDLFTNNLKKAYRLLIKLLIPVAGIVTISIAINSVAGIVYKEIFTYLVLLIILFVMVVFYTSFLKVITSRIMPEINNIFRLYKNAKKLEKDNKKLKKENRLVKEYSKENKILKKEIKKLEKNLEKNERKMLDYEHRINVLKHSRHFRNRRHFI